MKAVVTGMIGSYPVGGVAWDYGQYALGLERLGFEVYYLEDTGWETYNPLQGCYGEDCSYSVDFLQRSLGGLSPELGRRWHFRNLDGSTYGMSVEEFQDVLAKSELLLNVSGGTLLRDEYMACRRKVLIDTDPGWNHFRNYPRWDASPGWQGSHGYRCHDVFFTYAECIGKAECILPSLGLEWLPTRPPVVLNCWREEPLGDQWTTVMTWKNFQEQIEYKGTVYGTKEMEFGRVESLPRRSSAAFEVATGGPAPVERWRTLGWSVVDSHSVSTSPDAYRTYIQSSRGEFSVAKNVYVATHSGWFSCRTVCYLASGRPAVVQDTGFRQFIPTGKGLLAFTNLEEAVTAIDTVEGNYQSHQQAARELAATHFNSDKVLGDLLRQAGVG